MTTNPFIHVPADSVEHLRACDRFEAADHRWSQRELDALALAFATRRPLLVRGEPGSGKSQLARAAAKVMKAPPPLPQVIHPRFEPRDLLYRYDTIRRLSDANSGHLQVDAQSPDGAHAGSQSPEEKYVQPGVLWKAWEAASEGPVVVLIDEIDKGDTDVPNSLLEVLGQRSFKVEEVQGMSPPALPPDVMPLIIITTNEERELPAAFVRRCVVLNLNPPKDDDALYQWLLERVQAHQEIVAPLAPEVVDRALRQVLADRRDAERLGYSKVGLAEALDLLKALKEITAEVPEAERKAKQEEWLDRISAYALVKHADTQPGQSRLPVKAANNADA